MKRWSRHLGNLIRVLISVVLLLVAFGGYHLLHSSGPQPDRRPVTRSLPLVQPFEVQSSSYTVHLQSQGNILPRTQSLLTAEVAGKVDSMSPRFRVGSSFAEGEVLVSLDPHDHELRLARAQAAVVRTESALSLAQAQTDQARKDWNRFGSGEPSPLAIKLPQLREAEANLMSAQADVQEAKLNLSRCQIRAPYPGRVLQQSVDVGQYVSPGLVLGEIFATDAYEVRLPLREDQLPFLDLPLPGSAASGPPVTLQPVQSDGSWNARLSRTEPAIDPRTRQIFVVATLDLPPGAEPLLPSGTYVEASIRGHTFPEVLVIPRSAVRSGDTVMRVTPENFLEFTRLQILYGGEPGVVVAQPHPDLPPGTRISLTPLPFASPGDSVTVAGESPGAPPSAPPLRPGTASPPRA